MPTTEAEFDRAGHALETARLLLREPASADIPELLPLIGDWEVARWTSRIPHPYTARDAEAWLASAMRSENPRYFIFRREDRVLLGGIGLEIQGDCNEAILGYWLGRSYWGHGYMTEAADRVVRLAFENLGLAAVNAGALPENTASIRVQEKLGMHWVGMGSEDAPARGGTFEVELRRIERDHWLDERPTLPVVLVVAVALIDVDGRVLIAQRPEGKTMAGLWEFPGGKVIDGESPEAALVRELKEELDIDTERSCLAPFTFASHAYDEFHLLMPLYVCRIWDGTPKAREGQELAWVRPQQLRDYPMPPADRPLVAMLRDLL